MSQLDVPVSNAAPASQKPALPERVLGGLCATLNAAGTVLIGFVMVVINVDVFGRFLFDRPLTGVTEMVIMSIAAIVFLQFADTLRAGRIIQADALLNLLRTRRPRAYHGLQAAFNLLGALTFGVILYATVPFLQRAIASGDAYGNPAVFSLPKWPVRAIMIVGCAAVIAQFLLIAWRHVEAARAAKGGRPT